MKPNPTNLTFSLPKEYKEISYVLDDSEEQDDEEEEKVMLTINKENIIEGGKTWGHKPKQEEESKEDLANH